MTSTRSSKWVLFSALQREGRRMSVWLALFPILGFLYALCHGLLQALMNQDTDTVAAQDQTVRIFGSIALFLSAATIMAGAFFAISAFRFLYSRRQSDFYLSLPVTRRTFYFVKWVMGELVLLLAFCGAGIGCWLLPQLIPRKWHVQLDAGYGLRLLTVAFAAAAAFYCICLLCAVTAGKVWQYWTLLIGIGGCLPLGLISYAELFPAFLSGLNQQPVRIVALVSPIAYVPFGVQGVFDFRYLLLAALLVGAVSFFAGLFFYRRRSGECAEQTLSTPVVYVLATTGAALSLVCLPMLLTLQANQYGVYALLCGAGVGVMTLVCTLVYTRKVVNPTAAVLCSTLVVVTVGTVCLLGVQGSDYRNKVPAAEDVAQVTVQPMVEDPLVDLPDYMLEPGTHSVSTDTTESQELESSYTFTDPASVAAIVQLHRDCITAAETEVLGGSGFKSSFRYKLKNGKVLTRIYTAYGDKGANVIRSTKEYKQQQPFVKNSAKENLLLVSLISTERDDLYWNQTMEDNRGEVQVDQTAYYPAIRADFMELTRSDWTYMNMQDASWSTVSFAIYQVRPGTDSKTRRQLQKMDPEALRTYYNRFYSTHTDSDPPCPVVRSVVYLPNQSGGANRTLKLLQKDGFIYGAQTTLPSADQVETMLVSPICTVSADYTEGDGCLLGEPDSEDGYYLTRPESLLGGQVVRKNFASLYTDPFRTVTDRKAIARTLAGVQPGADQMERLKKAKQGYAVSLITKDGKATKMYFVPTAYGYEQGKPTTDAASDLAYALE